MNSTKQNLQKIDRLNQVESLIWIAVNRPSHYTGRFSMLIHGGERARHSEWYENSCMMVDYEFSQNFLSKVRLKMYHG